MEREISPVPSLEKRGVLSKDIAGQLGIIKDNGNRNYQVGGEELPDNKVRFFKDKILDVICQLRQM